MNNIFKQNTLNAIFFNLLLIYSKVKTSKYLLFSCAKSYGSAIYYVIGDPKAGEQYILTKYCKCNTFQVTTDLLNSENLKLAIAHLYHELHDIVCNYTIL